MSVIFRTLLYDSSKQKKPILRLQTETVCEMASFLLCQILLDLLCFRCYCLFVSFSFLNTSATTWQDRFEFRLFPSPFCAIFYQSRLTPIPSWPSCFQPQHSQTLVLTLDLERFTSKITVGCVEDL